MGLRSGLYSCYYLLMSLVLAALTLFMWVSIVPHLSDCATACPVTLLAPQNLLGGKRAACAASLPMAAQYTAACYSCSGDAAVQWPCPGAAGLAACAVDAMRPAGSCVSTFNATATDGRPIVSATAGAASVDGARCAAAAGVAPGAAACSTCIAAGACVKDSEFEGAGSYLDADSKRLLCFTTPLRIRLRPVVYPGIYLILFCYLFMALFMMLMACLLFTFRRTSGKTWAKLTFCQRSTACVIRTVPAILWLLNLVLLIFLLMAASMFWSIGVCSDAKDSLGVNNLAPVLSSSFAVSVVFFTATCCCGGCMRIFVAPDAAFMDVTVYDPDAPATSRGGQSGWRARCMRGVSLCSKLGP